jgi:N-acyl-L-homoserine lactone synthetase
MCVSARIDVPPGIAALDALAGQLLLRAGVRIGVAHTIAELEAVHRLRHRDVSADGWPGSASPTDALEPDPYDDHALQLAAWRGTTLAASMRLVLPMLGRRLPSEEAFDLDIEPRGEVVDLGRLLVGPASRGDPAHRAWGGLFALAWQESRARSYAVIAGIASTPLVERYRSLGVHVEILGPSRTDAGAELYPVRLDPAASEPPDWY